MEMTIGRWSVVQDDDFWTLVKAASARLLDRTPRMILADWLEDRGESLWAEAIRLYCVLSEGGSDPKAAVSRLADIKAGDDQPWWFAHPADATMRTFWRYGCYPEVVCTMEGWVWLEGMAEGFNTPGTRRIVWLTEWVRANGSLHGNGLDDERGALAELSRLWKGVTFRLPSNRRRPTAKNKYYL